jgi:hypothetical protein
MIDQLLFCSNSSQQNRLYCNLQEYSYVFKIFNFIFLLDICWINIETRSTSVATLDRTLGNTIGSTAETHSNLEY